MMKVDELGSRERCILLGEYMIEHQTTVRATAQVFGISKSTVHKDVTYTLKNTLVMEQYVGNLINWVYKHHTLFHSLTDML